MGYSIAIRTKSEAAQRKMVAFMQANFRGWPEVKGKPGGFRSAGDPSEDLSYDRGKRLIGFDYASHLHGMEREYTYTALRWMAIRVGSTKRRFSRDVVKGHTFQMPVPYTVYDGYEAWPVIVVGSHKEADKLPKGVRWCAYDVHGVRMGRERLSAPVARELAFAPGTPEDVLEAMRQEIRAMGECPKDVAGRDKHLERHSAIIAKHMAPYVKKALGEIGAEMRRLSALWDALA
jgi:hypothetical protein